MKALCLYAFLLVAMSQLAVGQTNNGRQQPTESAISFQTSYSVEIVTDFERVHMVSTMQGAQPAALLSAMLERTNGFNGLNEKFPNIKIVLGSTDISPVKTPLGEKQKRGSAPEWNIVQNVTIESRNFEELGRFLQNPPPEFIVSNVSFEASPNALRVAENYSIENAFKMFQDRAMSIVKLTGAHGYKIDAVTIGTSADIAGNVTSADGAGSSSGTSVPPDASKQQAGESSPKIDGGPHASSERSNGIPYNSRNISVSAIVAGSIRLQFQSDRR